ncbi:MAG: MFS transporter, partial [Candidatus Accumulibacter sp.]|nr:MFS transporter [Accumulibacter sp.]
LTEGYGVDLSYATFVVAMLQFGAIGGTLVGGVVADRVGNHGRVAITGMLGAAACALPIAHTGLPLPLILVLMTLVGGFVGLTLPSRDLLVRRAAPQGNLGKTFGTVYSGLDGGSLLGPLLIGPVLDHGAPQLLFVIAAIGFCLATFAVRGIRRPAPLAAA